MIALTIVVNTVGVVIWLRLLGRHLNQRLKQNTDPHLFLAILTTAITLLFLHILETLLWAVLYMHLPGQSGLQNLHEALYFSMITFTTLGYGDVTLTEQWQVLSGLEAMIGIIMFGMTTAMLYTVVQKCWTIRHKGNKHVHRS